MLSVIAKLTHQDRPIIKNVEVNFSNKSYLATLNEIISEQDNVHSRYPNKMIIYLLFSIALFVFGIYSKNNSMISLSLILIIISIYNVLSPGLFPVKIINNNILILNNTRKINLEEIDYCIVYKTEGIRYTNYYVIYKDNNTIKAERLNVFPVKRIIEHIATYTHVYTNISE